MGIVARDKGELLNRETDDFPGGLTRMNRVLLHLNHGYIAAYVPTGRPERLR